VRPELLEPGLAELRRLGLDPVVRPDVTARHRFTAGTDARRSEELTAALADPSIRAVWLARGGYGTTPLLAGLDPQPLVLDPKPIIGESDATALGCWALTAGVGWVHGPMVAASLREGPGVGHDEASLRACLFEGRGRLAPQSARTLAAGRAEGILWGGCLSLLAALAGTPWLPRIARSLIVIEDVGVKPYQVHRMLVQLRDAGALDGVAGVLLGDFSQCVQHEQQGYAIDEVLLDFFHAVAPGAPVTIGWPVGHCPGPHAFLPLGARARLDAAHGEAPELSFALAPTGDLPC